MCFSGGGDSGVAARAEQRATDEQARVKDAVSQLNTMFGVGSDPTATANKAARDGIYSGIEDATRTLNMNNLNTEYKTAARESGFDMARRGLYGGSANADALGNLDDTRNKAILQISDAATAAANDARAADDKTRLALAGDITNGLDSSTAIASAQNQLDSNAADARSAATQNALSGFFNTVLGNIKANAINTGYNNARALYPSISTPVAAGTVYKG